jgi:hypothetical protein
MLLTSAGVNISIVEEPSRIFSTLGCSDPSCRRLFGIEVILVMPPPSDLKSPFVRKGLDLDAIFLWLLLSLAPQYSKNVITIVFMQNHKKTLRLGELEGF